MNSWLRRILWILLALVPPILLDINSNGGWHQTSELWETRRYLVNAGLFWVMALEMGIFAFLAFKAQRRLLVGICLCLASALACWGASDFYITLFNYESTGPGGRLCLTHRNWFERVVHDNDLGFWEKDLKNLPAGRVVAAVGDSFTWGQGLLHAQDRYSDRLNSLLGADVEVLNFGMGGLNTREQITMILPKVAQVHPDLVLLFYLTNDIHDGLGLPLPAPKPRGKWEQRLLMGSPTWNYLYWKVLAGVEFREAAAQGNQALHARYQDPKNFRDHAEDLKSFAREVEAMGARPAAVILPFPHLWTDAPDGLRQEILDKVEQALKEAGMPVLNLADLEKEFPVGKFEVNSMDAHPNARVHQAIAERVAPWLKEQLQ